MSLYADSSAILKRYLDEPDSDLARALLQSDPSLLTARLTIIEVRRNLGVHLPDEHAAQARRAFAGDLSAFSIVELDETTCSLAASIAETTAVRSLDALHLAAAQRAGRESLSFLTFDLCQAQAARSLGFTVLGV